ncbi:MAG: hypothetical protein AAF629_19600, partial [Chloroflexota bacterium]
MMDQPFVENPTRLSLQPDLHRVLQCMFPDHKRVIIKEEFTSGFSSSRLFLVRPVRDKFPELQTVAKLAPKSLIQQEWEAYQEVIAHRLPGIARLEQPPVLPNNCEWGGLRYSMAGEAGTFEVQSLRRYISQANPEDIHFILEQQLFTLFNQMWRLYSPHPEFNLGYLYDRILPVNLLIDPSIPPPKDNTPTSISPTSLPREPLQPGDYIHLAGFTVTRVYYDHSLANLNVPEQHPGSYLVRLQGISPHDYEMGTTVPLIKGQVVETRYSRLRAEAKVIIGDGAEEDVIQFQDSINLSNPLIALPNLLRKSRDVKVSGIHGDLNLENVRVNPTTRTVSIIDFSDSRQDYVLHDLLRLETEVLVKVGPDLLADLD